MDVFNIPEDIYEVIFATKQQKIVGKLLIDYIKAHGGAITKVEMSRYATSLHEGNFVATLEEKEFQGKKVKLSYNKRQFYDRIVTPMKAMGLIEYNLYEKTYKLSDRFYKGLLEVGIRWKKELEKEAQSKIEIIQNN